jgi:hypothetical protein
MTLDHTAMVMAIAMAMGMAMVTLLGMATGLVKDMGMRSMTVTSLDLALVAATCDRKYDHAKLI